MAWRRPQFDLRAPLMLLAAMALAGCATQTITASLPAIVNLPGEPDRVAGRTADVYAQIAGGANACWFAVNGQLKKSHIFHADADSPAAGGAVEIAVMERDLAGPKPWGAKAFRIVLAQSGDQTTLGVENLKMAEAVSAQMRADVFHWAQGGRDCRLKPIESPPPPPEPARKKMKPKAKTAAR